jgi:hypothetical protein
LIGILVLVVIVNAKIGRWFIRAHETLCKTEKDTKEVKKKEVFLSNVLQKLLLGDNRYKTASNDHISLHYSVKRLILPDLTTGYIIGYIYIT